MQVGHSHPESSNPRHFLWTMKGGGLSTGLLKLARGSSSSVIRRPRMIQSPQQFRTVFAGPSQHSLPRTFGGPRWGHDKGLFADGCLLYSYSSAESQGFPSSEGYRLDAWGVLLEHDLRWRETLHAFNTRSSFEEDIMIVIMLYVSEGTSVIRFEELGRMALISPYVIDTRIQRLRFVVGDIIPALSRKNRSNEGIERERESCYPLDWLPNRGVTLLSTHKKTKRFFPSFSSPCFRGSLSIRSY